MIRTMRLSGILLIAAWSCGGISHAAAAGPSREMVQLQTQIQQLQDAVARLQQSNDERMGALKDLVQQSAASVTRLSLNMDVLQKQLSTQQGAEGTKVDQVSGQVQAMSDSLDEMKARMARLEKAVGEIQGQTQSINAALQNMPQGGGAATGETTSAAASAPAGLASGTLASGSRVKPTAAIPSGGGAAPVSDLYKAAFSDYMAARYPIATSEFGDVIKSYPADTLAGNSFYYLGEIDYRAGKFAAAAKDYDKVLEQFPDSSKIPAAHLHKGQALIALNQNDAGIRELRTLIQRFPTSPEATQARSKLSGMGVSSHAKN